MPVKKPKLGALVVALIASASIVESADFCTLTPATNSVPLQLANRVKTVRLGFRATTTSTCDGSSESMYFPSTIHWHLYSLQNESDEPRIAIEPTNFLLPQLDDETGVLEFDLQSSSPDLQSSLLRSSYPGMEFGVALWLPSSYMTSVELVPPSEPETFELGFPTNIMHVIGITYNGTEALHVHNAGVDNQHVSVLSRQAEVYYNATGAHTTANIDANGQRGSFSKVGLSGENVAASISVPLQEDPSNMSSVSLQVEISGTNNEIKIDGSYGTISMTGTAAKTTVNTKCDGIYRRTVNAGECFFDIGINVNVYDHSCFAIDYPFDLCQRLRHQDEAQERAAIVGLVGGSVGLVAILGCSIYAYFRRRRAKRLSSTSVTGTIHDEQAVGNSFPTMMDNIQEQEAGMGVVPYHEVPAIPIDPHLITAKPSDSEPDKCTDGILQ